MQKYPKNSTTIRDLQNSLFIHKMFTDSKNDHVFEKMCVKSQNFSWILKITPPISKTMSVRYRNVRRLNKIVKKYSHVFANSIKCSWIRKCSKIGKSVHEFEKCSRVEKMFMISRNWEW